MNEATKQMQTATSDSALAITDSRASTHRRPGGCVGIFFQLLDWNRRFAKKKIFSKKFLGQARSKPVAECIGPDEVLPKTGSHLASDETTHGVSNVKKRYSGGRGAAVVLEGQQEMKAAGLVARLMGLESLPDLDSKDSTLEKCKSTVNVHDREERHNSCCDSSLGEDLDIVKRGFKSGMRPRKLLKAGKFDRESVTRFGAEALHLKTVLSSSKRYRHSHQPKHGSPRSPTLLSARNAARTSRLIGAATKILEPGLQATNRSKNAIAYSSRANHTPKKDVMLSELLKHEEQQNCAGISRPIIAQASCKNCGNWVDLVENGTLSCSDQFLSDADSDITNLRNSTLLTSGGDDQPSMKLVEERSQEVHQSNWESRDDMTIEIDTKSVLSHTGKPVGKNRISSQERLATLQSRRAYLSDNAHPRTEKALVALRKITNSKIKSKEIGRYRESIIAAEIKASQYRKKVGFNSYTDNGEFPRRSVARPRNGRLHMSGWKDNRSVESSCVTGISVRQSGNDARAVRGYSYGTRVKEQNCDSASFPEWQSLADESSLLRRKQVPDERKESVKTVQESLVSREAALGQFLEQKLGELAVHRDGRPNVGGMSHKRSVSTLLQELITALSTEQTPVPSPKIDNSSTILKVDDQIKRLSANVSNKTSRLNNGSVHEPSFYSGSCLIGHCNNSGSVSEMNSDGIAVIHMLDHITELLKRINLSCGNSISDQLSYAKEVLMNAELIFHNATKLNPTSVCSFLQFCLLDELDTFAVAISTYIGSLAFAGSKGKTKLRSFMFDCLVEFFNIKYGPVFTMSWRRLPCQLDTTMLMDEVAVEVHRWTISAAVIPDLEMNQMVHKWTDFEVEIFETGAKLCDDILKILVHEVISEL